MRIKVENMNITEKICLKLDDLNKTLQAVNLTLDKISKKIGVMSYEQDTTEPIPKQI